MRSSKKMVQLLYREVKELLGLKTYKETYDYIHEFNKKLDRECKDAKLSPYMNNKWTISATRKSADCADIICAKNCTSEEIAYFPNSTIRKFVAFYEFGVTE